MLCIAPILLSISPRKTAEGFSRNATEYSAGTGLFELSFLICDTLRSNTSKGVSKRTTLLQGLMFSTETVPAHGRIASLHSSNFRINACTIAQDYWKYSTR